jgi:hypothetical protein
MTIPQFDDTPTVNAESGGKRDPNEFIPWDRVAEVSTPRGTRPGLVMIVRPLELIKESQVKRTNNPDEDWKTLVIADIAVLDAIPPGQDQYGMPLDAVAPGSQWRNQLVFPGMLNKAWRDKIGGTMIGVVFMGEARRLDNGTMGKRPFLWRSLAQDPNQVRRGQGFMQARPEFLIPVPRQIQPPAQQTQYAQPDQGYAQAYTQAPPAPDPWAQQAMSGHIRAQSAPPAQQPQYQQQPAQGYAQPVSAAPAYQSDPWTQQAPPASYASATPQQVQQQAAMPAMSTLDQMRRQAQADTQLDQNIPF